MKYSVLIILFALFFVSCTKDQLPDPDACRDLITPSGIHLGPVYINDLPYYSSPCFNPNNEEEIIYLGADGLDTFKLYKLNLKTNERSEILEGLIYPIPRWSVKDWIIFSKSDFNVYKIKSNGDSLTQLTDSGNCFGPVWNKEGNSFIYHEGFTTPTRGIVCEEDGLVIDTIIGVGQHNWPSWRHDSLIAYGDLLALLTVNPQTHEVDTISRISISDAGFGGGVEWIDNENIIWSYRKGIFKTNIKTKETTLLKESCTSSIYLSPTYSPQSGKLIYQRVDKFQRGEKAGKAVSKLYIMNVDATDEKEIVIPE